MARFKFAYFDLDDTLLDHRHAERMALADLVTMCPPLRSSSVDRVRSIFHEVNQELWRRYGEGEIDRHALQRRRFEGLLGGLGARDGDAHAIGDLYMRRYAKHWRSIDGSVPAMSRVAERMPVGIITNGFSEVQRHKLDRFPAIRALCSDVLISEDVGYMKPHPELFSVARERAGVDGPILYVGDSFESDVLGGVRAGWTVAWFQRDDASQSEARLSQLAGHAPDSGGSAFAFSDWDDLVDRVLGR